MKRRFLSPGVWGSAALALAGVWLLLAPSLAAGHVRGAPWTDPVRDDVVVGAALVLLGACAILLHVGWALAEAGSGDHGDTADGLPGRRATRGRRRSGGV